jgi:hypothetical protein
MATGLFTPILNDRTRSPYFFNGRLLTGEAMTDEQRAQHVAHEILAHGVGDGVAYGLQVTPSHDFNTVDRPVVTVKAGAAVSRRGDLLLLADDVDVQLVRPVSGSVAPQKIFDACKPPEPGTYVADSGVYLLTIAPITVGDQLAPVSGLGGPQTCNVKYRVNAVEFRLVKLPVDSSVLADSNRLRNRVAYACFGIDQITAFALDPIGATGEPKTLLDEIDGKTIANCDVPLAVLYWTATGGIQFIDMWSVRRRLTHSRTGVLFPPVSDKRLATAEAMVLQFQEQIATLRRSMGQAPTIVATTYFRFLPPVGLLPIAGTGFTGVSTADFFKNLTTGTTVFIEGSRLRMVVDEAIPYFPIDTTTKELIWLYQVRENRQAIDKGGKGIPGPAIVFVSGHVPYRADPHFDVNKWDYSNYV